MNVDTIRTFRFASPATASVVRHPAARVGMLVICMTLCSCANLPEASFTEANEARSRFDGQDRLARANGPDHAQQRNSQPKASPARSLDSARGTGRPTVAPGLKSASAGVAHIASQPSSDFSPAEPRWPIQQTAYNGPQCPPVATYPGCPPQTPYPPSAICPQPLASDEGFATAAASPADYPDEYLFDGGDRGLPIHYDPFNRLGMESEDTVAEFVDHEGQFHVKATNRVAIYAPRFGTMRTISSPSGGTSVERLASAHDSLRDTRLTQRVTPKHHLQNDGIEDVRVRSRASGLESKSVGAGTSQVLRSVNHMKLQNLYQEIGRLFSGQFEQSDEARLASSMQAAANWSRDQNPVIAATTSASVEVYAWFRPQELVGLELDKQTKGDLHIVKLADKLTAKPGDVITFTIRYENLGELNLHHIRVIDNLTPRLEFMEDSAESDRPGRVHFEDNAEGTVILRFTLDDPLPGKAGGVITFQARVR